VSRYTYQVGDFETVTDSTQYFYHSNGLLSEELRLTISGEWLTKTSYQYDGNNNQTLRLYQNWDENSWINYWQETYGYDGSDNQTLILRTFWSNNNNSWHNDWQNTYEYDENDNLILGLRFDWGNGSWNSNGQITYEYNENNNPVRYECSNWCHIADYRLIRWHYDLINSNSQVQPAKNTFRLFPNPGSTYLTIDLEVFEYPSGTIAIYNSTG